MNRTGNEMSNKFSFEGWLSEIDRLAIASGAADAGQSYVGWTGEDCWVSAYDSGMNPSDAWAEEAAAAAPDMDTPNGQ